MSKGGGGKGRMANLASPLPVKVDPVGNATSKALFGTNGKDDNKQRQVAASQEQSQEQKQSTTSAVSSLTGSVKKDDEETRNTLGI